MVLPESRVPMVSEDLKALKAMMELREMMARKASKVLKVPMERMD